MLLYELLTLKRPYFDVAPLQVRAQRALLLQMTKKAFTLELDLLDLHLLPDVHLRCRRPTRKACGQPSLPTWMNTNSRYVHP